jgi:membrane-bound lytic murein transglycosylase D
MSEDAICADNADLYARRLTVEPSTGEVEGTDSQADDQQGEWVTTEKVKYHKVRKGETLQTIANKYGVSLWSVKHANGNIKTARRGQTLKIVTTEKTFKPTPATPDNTQVAKEEPVVETEQQLAANDTAAPEAAPEQSSSSKAVESAFAKKSAAKADVAATDAKVDSVKESSAKAAKAETTTASSKKAEATSSKSTTEKSSTSSSKKKSKKDKKQSSKTVTAKNGDSLARIAKKNGTTVAELKKLNNLSGSNPTIQPGQKIRVK